MTQLLCYDIGFTFTRVAIFEDGRLIKHQKIRTPQTRLQAGTCGDTRRRLWLEDLQSITREWRGFSPRITQIGICFPGVVSTDGEIWQSNTIWGNTKNGLSLTELESWLGLPVTVINDLVAAAIRYGEQPRFSRSRYVLVVSVSSGIGAKMYDVQARKVMLESRGRNGEIGLARVAEGADALTNDNGRLAGILGNYASGVGFARLIQQAALMEHDGGRFACSLLASRLANEGEKVTMVDRAKLTALAVDCIHQRDPFCLDMLDSAIAPLAAVLHTIILFAAPEVIVITGGFASHVGDIYLERLSRSLAERITFLYSSEEIHELVRLGDCDDMDNLIGLESWMRRSAASTV